MTDFTPFFTTHHNKYLNCRNLYEPYLEASTKIRSYPFLQGGGEMGELTRNLDWSQTSIGSPDNWPQSLRTTLSILLNSKFPMFLFWGPDMICFYNDAFRPSLGIEGKHPKSLGKKGEDVWQEIWPTIKPWLDQVKDGGESIWMEDQLVGFYRNGRMEDIYWTFSYSPVSDETGKISGVFVTCTETTDKVMNLHNIEKAKREFEDLVLQAPVAIAVFRGEDLVAEIANDAYLLLVGKTREELLGKPMFQVLPETRETLEPLAKDLFRTGKTYPAYEFEILINRFGRDDTCYFNFVWEPVNDEEGKTNGFMVVAHEVTEEVKARKKLEEVITELTIFKSLADGVTDFIGICDMDMIPLYINPSGLKKAGLPLNQDFSQLKVIDFFYPEDHEYIRNVFIPEVMKNGTAETEIRFRHFETGKPVWMLYNVIFLTNRKGEPYGFATISKDVTEQKLFREELKKQVSRRTHELEEKNQELRRTNASLEEFAYAASHDLKEPIRKIHFYSERLKSQLSDRLKNDEVHFFNRLEKAARRMGNLIDDLLSYSQVSFSPQNFEAFDLNQVMQQVLVDLELEINETHAHIHIDPLPVIRAHPRQIQQALQNLLSNAIKFHKPGEEPIITISTKKLESNDNSLPAQLKEQSKCYHLIEVMDQGIGFPQEEASRIFNVFTRLHGNTEYQGTGVGLSIVQKVADHHGGFVQAFSEEGKGARFLLFLPITD